MKAMLMNATKMHSETDERGVVYSLFIEQDQQCFEDGIDDVAAIQKRLDDGDIWAWAAVTVQATVPGCTTAGYACLCGCSYRDTAEFIEPGGYWEDMKLDAAIELRERLEACVKALDTMKGGE